MDLNILTISQCVILYCVHMLKSLTVTAALEKHKFQVEVSFPIFLLAF